MMGVSLLALLSVLTTGKLVLVNSEAHSEHCQIYKMEDFVKIANGF